MKKIILAASILFSSCVVAQVGQVVIKTDSTVYINGYEPIVYDSLSEDNKVVVDNFLDMINDVKQAPLQPVMYVAYNSGVFTITGDAYPPVLADYGDMTAENKAIINAWKQDFLDSTGVALVTFKTRFGTNEFTVNGVEYNFSDFNTVAFRNAIILANTLYNEQ